MFAFTEQGVAMLATILKSPNAVDVSITILRAFVAMRHFLLTNAQIFLRLERVESKQHETDAKIEQVFAKLEEKTLKPQQGLFFDGQVFDAYEFVCNLIKRASSRIILIDNYVDESVLTMLDKRKQCPIRSGMTWVSARQVGQAGLEVKRNLALHEEDGLAGDEDAGAFQGDAEGAAAGGELPRNHFGFSQFIGPEGGQVGVGAAGDGVFGDVQFGVEAAGDEVVIV